MPTAPKKVSLSVISSLSPSQFAKYNPTKTSSFLSKVSDIKKEKPTLAPVRQGVTPQYSTPTVTTAPLKPGQQPRPADMPLIAGNVDYKSIATQKEKEAFSQMLQDGLSPDRASAALKFAIDKRLELESDKKTLGQKIGQGVKDVGGGILSSIQKTGRIAASPIQWVGEKAGSGLDKLMGTNYQAQYPFQIAGQGLVDKAPATNEQIRQSSSDLLGSNKESIGFKGGEIVGDIATSGVATAATAGLAGSALGGTALATQATNIATKYPKLATAAKLFAQGGLDSNYYMLQSEGKTSPVDTVLGGGINVALGGLGNVAKKGSKALANKLQLSGLINPKKLEYVQTALRETGDQVDNVTKWMDERGISGGKSKIINKLDDAAKITRSAVIEAGKKADEVATPIKDKSIKGALEYLTDAVSGSKSPKTQAVYDDLVVLLKKHDDIGLIPSEIQKVKDKIDDIASLYTQAGDVKAGVAKQDLANLRSDIRKLIEDEVSKYTGIDVGKLNRDTAVAKQLAIGIKIKDNADSIRDLLSPFASPALGGAVGFVGGDGDRKSVLKGLALGTVAGNTAVKSAAAQGIKNLITKKTAGEVIRRTGAQATRDLITKKNKGEK